MHSAGVPVPGIKQAGGAGVCLTFPTFGSGHTILLWPNGWQSVSLTLGSFVMHFAELLPPVQDAKAPWQMTLAEFSRAYKLIRYFQRYSSEQRADRAALFRLGPVLREPVGEYCYIHPLLPDRAYPSPSRARRATHWHFIEQALRQSLPVPATVLAEYSPLLWKEFLQ